MNYYEKNLKCIKEHKSYLYNSIQKADISAAKNHIEVINSINTKDGQQAVIIKLNSAEYRLNSIYYPTKEAEMWVKQYKFHNLGNIMSMYGFGNGIFARTILENMEDSNILLIYEPCSEIFMHVLNKYDITDILSNKRVSIAVEGINEFEFHNSLQGVMNITNLSSQIMCIYPQYDKIFPESCITFWNELKDSYSHAKININTEIYFGKRFIDNTLNNFRFIQNSNTLVELKSDIPKNIPAIVVAAGPSVEKNIENLKRAKGKSVIFAVDRIVDYLLNSGVEPDFIVTVDPVKPLDFFTQKNNLSIPLLCFLESNHEILNHHVGRKIICNCTLFLDEFYLKNKKIPPRMRSSASVATIAFTACVELGFENIILVGQDLAYDGTYSHAGGVEEKITIVKDVMVEGIDGQLVRSRFDWKEFITWYQDMLILNPKLNVIDAKDKGAKIKGTINMPLHEVVDKYCIEKFDCNKVFENKEVTFNIDELFALKEYFESNIEILDIIKEKSEDAIESYKNLIKENDRNNVCSYKEKDILNKLSNINEYISKKPIYTLIDYFVTAVSAQLLSEMYHFTDDIIEDSIKTYKKSICVYEAVIEAVNYIKPRLEKAIENVITEEDKI